MFFSKHSFLFFIFTRYKKWVRGSIRLLFLDWKRVPETADRRHRHVEVQFLSGRQSQSYLFPFVFYSLKIVWNVLLWGKGPRRYTFSKKKRLRVHRHSGVRRNDSVKSRYWPRLESCSTPLLFFSILVFLQKEIVDVYCPSPFVPWRWSY